MKQIEITTRVNQNLKEIDEILTKQGFKIIRKSKIKDKYLSQKELNKENILETLKNSVLIRYLCINDEETYKKITYKKKTYNGDNVISEEKININIDDIDNAEKLFNALDFKKIVDVNYEAIVYSKENLELCFQNVENLGILLEYENLKDFEGANDEEIIKEKHKMLEEIKQYNLNISDEYDIKKAYELIKGMNKC